MFRRIASAMMAAVLAAATLFTALPAQAAEATYFSELTGEPISTAIQNQRPVAVMIDNDIRSYPHYGTAQADIVYELTNSIANNGVTRLMAVYKDWNNVARIGNIRSTRPTNIILAQEYNAVIVKAPSGCAKPKGLSWANEIPLNQHECDDRVFIP